MFPNCPNRSNESLQADASHGSVGVVAKLSHHLNIGPLDHV
jgi:hypothetical protein